MKIMNEKLMLVGLVALAVNAEAATMMQSGTILNGPTSPAASFPKTTMFTFNQFDDMGGTLNLLGVTLTISAEAGANVTGDNEAGGPASFFGRLVGQAVGTIPTAPSVEATANLNQTAGPVPVGADSDDEADLIGDDSHEFINVSDIDEDSDSTSLPAELLAFIGTGTLSGQVEDTQDWFIGGGGNALNKVDNSHSVIDWTVTYEFESVVPEPSSVLLSGIALLGLLRRRR